MHRRHTLEQLFLSCSSALNLPLSSFDGCISSKMQETSDRNALEAELRAFKKERIEAEAEQTQKLVDLRAKLASAETAMALAERSAQEAEKRARDVLEMHTTSQADAESRFDPHLTGTAQLFMYGTVRHIRTSVDFRHHTIKTCGERHCWRCICIQIDLTCL